jgi:predicted lipase
MKKKKKTVTAIPLSPLRESLVHEEHGLSPPRTTSIQSDAQDGETSAAQSGTVNCNMPQEAQFERHEHRPYCGTNTSDKNSTCDATPTPTPRFSTAQRRSESFGEHDPTAACSDNGEPRHVRVPTLLEEAEECLAQSNLIFLLADLRLLSATGRIHTSFDTFAIDSDRVTRTDSGMLAQQLQKSLLAGAPAPECHGIFPAQIMAVLLIELRKEVQSGRARSAERRVSLQDSTSDTIPTSGASEAKEGEKSWMRQQQQQGQKKERMGGGFYDRRGAVTLQQRLVESQQKAAAQAAAMSSSSSSLFSLWTDPRGRKRYEVDMHSQFKFYSDMIGKDLSHTRPEISRSHFMERVKSYYKKRQGSIISKGTTTKHAQAQGYYYTGDHGSDPHPQTSYHRHSDTSPVIASEFTSHSKSMPELRKSLSGIKLAGEQQQQNDQDRHAVPPPLDGDVTLQDGASNNFLSTPVEDRAGRKVPLAASSALKEELLDALNDASFQLDIVSNDGLNYAPGPSKSTSLDVEDVLSCSDKPSISTPSTMKPLEVKSSSTSTIVKSEPGVSNAPNPQDMLAQMHEPSQQSIDTPVRLLNNSWTCITENPVIESYCRPANKRTSFLSDPGSGIDGCPSDPANAIRECTSNISDVQQKQERTQQHQQGQSGPCGRLQQNPSSFQAYLDNAKQSQRLVLEDVQQRVAGVTKRVGKELDQAQFTEEQRLENLVTNFFNVGVTATDKGAGGMLSSHFTRPLTEHELLDLMERAVESRRRDRVRFMASFFREGTVSNLMAKSTSKVVWLNDWYPLKDPTYAISIDEEKKRVLVVFRGAITRADWGHSYDLGVARTPNPIAANYKDKKHILKFHRGFYLYLFRRRKDTNTSKYDEIAAKVEQYAKVIGKDYKIVVTGHSLGAALGTLFSFYASLEERFTRNAPVKLISFGCPYVGGYAFGDAFRYQEQQRKIIYARFHNERDIITHGPNLNLRCSMVSLSHDLS